jgi:hypothetical protein
MKRLVIVIVVLMILLCACTDNISDLTNSKVCDNNENEIKKMKMTNNYNYSVEKFEDFVKWIKEYDTKENDDNAFTMLINKYRDMNYLIKPLLWNGDCDKIFVDSNVMGINYIFSKLGIRIYTEPLLYAENDIANYIKENYGYSFDKKELIDFQNSKDECSEKNEFDNEYHYVKKIDVKFADGERECVLETQYSPEKETVNNLSFIQNDMIIRIIFYGKDDSLSAIKEFSTLSFERIKI